MFEDLGLRDELLRALEGEDVETPTALQEAVIPALRRGGNLVARASSGSGKTLAYTLGVLDRLESSGNEDEVSLRLLVLTAVASEAERVALAMIPYVQSLGFRVAVPASAWGTALEEAEILIGPPRIVMNAVRSSSLKLEQVEAVVIDGASAIAELGEVDDADALLDLVPRDAQRVLISATLSAPVEDLVERRVKRALRYPAEPALAVTQTSAISGTVGYVVASERMKLELLAEQLAAREPGSVPPIIFCRNDERAAELAERLSIRGFLVGQVDEEGADVAIAAGGVSRAELIEELDGESGQTISYDVPADVVTLRNRHDGDDDAIVLIEARELAHLREIAHQASFRLRPTPHPREVPASTADLEIFRSAIRSAIAEEDLTAQLLVLEPLLDEFPAAEVAAAAAALLRSRRLPAAATERSAAQAEPSRRTPPDTSAPVGPAPVTWARLFVGIGSRDDVRAGDLVGTLAGEANIPGSNIGKIEIRDSFSIVEVQAAVADQVIRAVNGTTIKGRSVRVDYDRGGPARRPPSRGGSMRRTSRQPPGA